MSFGRSECSRVKIESLFNIIFSQNFVSESAIGFGLAKGDLVKLDKSYEEYGDAEVYTGTSVKNDKHGSIPRDILYILPTIEEPKANVMVSH